MTAECRAHGGVRVSSEAPLGRRSDCARALMRSSRDRAATQADKRPLTASRLGLAVGIDRTPSCGRHVGEPCLLVLLAPATLASMPTASLRDRIFPPGTVPRDGNIARTEWVGTWESQLIGLGRLTGFLSPRLITQSHAIDDMALNLVFLERHRIEVGLKLVLERAGQQIPRSHRLGELRDQCERACTGTGLATEWTTMVAPHDEYVDLMDSVDPGGSTCRYPWDSNAMPWSRDQFVDVLALETAGSGLQEAILELVELLAAREPSPISPTDAVATARELRDLSVACREVIKRREETIQAFRAEGERLLGGRPFPSDPAHDVYRAGEALVEYTIALADRSDRALSRIVAATGIAYPPDPSPLPPLTPVPRLTPLAGSLILAQQQHAQIKWFTDAFIPGWRRWADAVRAVESRTATWMTPAARQLHLDVARFASRMFVQGVSQPGASPSASPNTLGPAHKQAQAVATEDDRLGRQAR